MGALFTKPRLKSIALKSFAGVSLFNEVLPFAASVPGSNALAKSAVTPIIVSLAELKQTMSRRRHEQFRLLNTVPGNTQVSVLRAAILTAIAGTPALVSEQGAISASLKKLSDAKSTAEVLRAENRLLGEIEDGHNRAFTNLIQRAAIAAFQRIGLPSVEVTSPTATHVRMIAQDQSGRTLVSEINTHPGREPSISTEVLGVCHGAAAALLEEFDQALEHEGVRSAGPPQRKKTGGVAQLEAAREFVHRVVRPLHSASSKKTSVSRPRNQARLNSRQRQRQ